MQSGRMLLWLPSWRTTCYLERAEPDLESIPGKYVGPIEDDSGWTVSYWKSTEIEPICGPDLAIGIIGIVHHPDVRPIKRHRRWLFANRKSADGGSITDSHLGNGVAKPIST